MHLLCLLTTGNDVENSDNKLLDSTIIQISSNNKLALETLYTHTKTAVYGFALSILKNTTDAEDVLHDTYLQIFSSAHSYSSQGKPMAWILTITRNLCLMKLRQQKKIADNAFEDTKLLFSDNSSITLDDKIVLVACLKQLSDVEYQIVTLHAITGLKHREIAQILSIPLSTVLSKYRRAIKKLKIFLEKGEF